MNNPVCNKFKEHIVPGVFQTTYEKAYGQDPNAVKVLWVNFVRSLQEDCILEDEQTDLMLKIHPTLDHWEINLP